MLHERLLALMRDLERLVLREQQRLADRTEQWLEDIEWSWVLNAPGPDALYDRAIEEIHQRQTQPLRLEDFAVASGPNL